MAPLRSGWLADQPNARIAGWVLFAGAIAASVELVLHTLAGYEDDAFTAGESTPMTDLHVLLQAVLLPLYGMGVAALLRPGSVAWRIRSRARWVSSADWR